MLMNTTHEAGEANPLVISNIVTGLLVVVLTGICIWLFIGYNNYKNNADTMVASAIKIAKADQSKDDEAAFLEREKVPTKQFQGPADLGSVSFQYPRTWSVYTAKNVDTLEAYLHPNVIPPVATTQPFALRVLVEDRQYEVVLKTYDGLIRKGDIRSNPVTVEGFSGVRLDGKLSKERDGSAVIFKVRDKTLTLATDISAYQNDFNETILKSLKFNP